ncbi:MAG: hypothetical protein AAF731_12180 [Bacteroidota bacterium]
MERKEFDNLSEKEQLELLDRDGHLVVSQEFHATLFKFYCYSGYFVSYINYMGKKVSQVKTW